MTLPTHPSNFSQGRRAQAAVTRALAPHWGALLALALFLIVGLAVLDDYGVTPDESDQRSYAAANLTYLLGEADALPVDPAVSAHVNFYGMAFELPLLLVERAFGVQVFRGIYLARHLLTTLFFLVGGLFAYLLVRRLPGEGLIALFAMLIFLLHPRLYAHSFPGSKDIPFLVMFIIALFLARAAFKRDTLLAFALLGVGVGMLANLRIMGVILLAAVPAMRALDLAFARDWGERKRALLSTGVFALSSLLTVYALLPYLWADPLARAVEWWTTLSQHPHIDLVLFRGMVYLSVDAPPEYAPVWFSITSPPFALLLGLIGAAVVVGVGAKAPLRSLRNTRLRFYLLLVGCFALPVIATASLGANIYNSWRHLYFLWAPFALLAAFGLRWLVASMNKRPLRSAAYGAAGAGLAATLVSMVLIHPNQQVYFNALVDRATPEHLRTQYTLDYWAHSMRQGFEWILDQSPSPDAPIYANEINSRFSARKAGAFCRTRSGCSTIPAWTP